MKTCKRCAKKKKLTDFGNRKKGSKYTNSYCKTCQTELTRIWQKKNQDKDKEYHRKWYLNYKAKKLSKIN